MFRSIGQANLFDAEDGVANSALLSGGADVRLVPGFLTAEQASALFTIMRSMDGWHQDHIRVYGKSHPLPRLHRWFASSGESYRWSGIEMRPEPFPDALAAVRRRLEHESGVSFNTALGNLYRDGKDGVSWHADDEPDLGPNPTIASLSLGAPRRFLLRKKDDHSVTASFELSHGSLLWMSGATQALWEHSLPKTAQTVGPRINVTFRAIRG